jgi:ubiquinone/menaquinone biosynthesis C-methylase UbiE
MISRVFIALSTLPGMKKLLWRALYGYLAALRNADGWTFMNYGFAKSEGADLALALADEANRHWIQLYDHVVGNIDLEGQEEVVEVGSGRGGGASFIKRYRRPKHMVGLDLSAKAVALCRETHSIEGLEFRVGDAEKLPFQDKSVDAVINVESSHCYPSFATFVAEVRRVLRPGGHFLYADFRRQEDLSAWRESLQSSGLTLICETNITRNVLLALDRDNERKDSLIQKFVPRVFQPSFRDFAGMRGSAVYEGFRNGNLSYLSFVLRKDATA